MSSANPDGAVDSAYQKLELMIRNYSREKMGLEEKVAAMRHQVGLREQDLEEKNNVVKSMTLENDRLKALHEEDGKSRYAVEALVTSSEQETQLLVDTFTSYDEKFQDIEEILRMYDDFNTAVKKRYLVLHKVYTDEVARNREMTGSLQREIQQKDLDLEDLSNHCNDLSAGLRVMTSEKGELADQYLDLVSAKNCMETQLNEKLAALVEVEQKLSLELEHKTAEVLAMQHLCDKLRDDLNLAAAENDEAHKLHSALKVEQLAMESKLKNELSSAQENEEKLTAELRQKDLDLEDLSNRCNDLSAGLRVMTSEKGELVDQYQDLVSAKNCMETQLNEKLAAVVEVEQKLSLELEHKTAEVLAMQNLCDKLRDDLNLAAAENDEAHKLHSALKVEQLAMESKFKNELSSAQENEEKLKAELEHKTAEVLAMQILCDKLRDDLNLAAAENDEAHKLHSALKVDQLAMESKFKNELSSAQENEEKLKAELEHKTAEVLAMQTLCDKLRDDLNLAAAENDEAHKLHSALKVDQLAMESKFKNELSSAQENEEKLKAELEHKTAEVLAMQTLCDKLRDDLNMAAAENDEAHKVHSALKVDQLAMESKLKNELSSAQENEEKMKAELSQQSTAVQTLQQSVADLEKTMKTLTIEKEAATKRVTELTASKEAKETQLGTVLSAGKKWKAESLAKAKALKQLQTEHDILEQKYQALKKGSAKNQPPQIVLPTKKSLETVSKTNSGSSASKTPARTSFRRSFPPALDQQPKKSILKSVLDTSVDRKSVSFCSPVQHTWSSSPDSDESQDNDHVTEIDADFQTLQVDSQESGPGQKRDNQTAEMDVPAGKKVKPSEPSTPDAGRKFFRRSDSSTTCTSRSPVSNRSPIPNRSPKSPAQCPMTPRRRYTASQQ